MNNNTRSASKIDEMKKNNRAHKWSAFRFFLWLIYITDWIELCLCLSFFIYNEGANEWSIKNGDDTPYIINQCNMSFLNNRKNAYTIDLDGLCKKTQDLTANWWNRFYQWKCSLVLRIEILGSSKKEGRLKHTDIFFFLF